MTMDNMMDRIVESLTSDSTVVLIIGDRKDGSFEVVSNENDDEYISGVLDAASDHVKSTADPDSYLHKMRN